LVIVRHALRNALIPALTVIGISLGALLGGAVVTETVFTIPGMGRLVVQSIARASTRRSPRRGVEVSRSRGVDGKTARRQDGKTARRQENVATIRPLSLLIFVIFVTFVIFSNVSQGAITC
jgi:ABC-type dipeptide/oligopeptide/nickel transport system permease component